MTRGQVTKFVAQAGGLTEPIPANQQTFEDVPNTNAFWVFIERLSGIGAINGYNCGGPGEPCVPPDNRPYFRWGNDVTRGQTAKVVANAFYPNCQTPDPPGPRRRWDGLGGAAAVAGAISR